MGIYDRVDREVAEKFYCKYAGATPSYTHTELHEIYDKSQNASERFAINRILYAKDEVNIITLRETRRIIDPTCFDDDASSRYMSDGHGRAFDPSIDLIEYESSESRFDK